MSGLFKTPAVPQVATAAPMPDPNSPSVIEAQKIATASALARAGRSSTILGKQGGAGASKAPVATAATGADSYSGSSLGTGNAQ